MWHIWQGRAGVTFGSLGMGTGIDNFIPEVWEREGNEKKRFPKFRNGKGMKKTFPKFGNGKGMKKSIPKIWEREGNEKIHSRISGTGIRGFHSWEWMGTGIPAHPWLPRNFCHPTILYYTIGYRVIKDTGASNWTKYTLCTGEKPYKCSQCSYLIH